MSRVEELRDDCACLAQGPEYPDAIEEAYVGRDDTEGRFADVTLVRCRRCRRLWLRYFVEYEAFSRSGRWAMAVIDEKTVAGITPETAVAFIEGADWHVFGGSFFGHAGKRGRGRVNWRP